ncbi:hypothetical protein OF83DRAFT_1160707 [Amylostereum chailletii]|nr:hypothetical protein OF83DRAFT_1160707 [Amylostereum chailletii]
MAPPSGVVGTVPAPAPMDMRKADMRAVEMDKMNQVQGTMSEIARECGILVDFAARYAELQARQPNVHPSPEEVTEMSERAGHVVRLIEELRRLAHPAIVIPPIPAAALSASAASSPSVVSTSGGGAQEDHRGPKRPWEDMASSSGEAQEARASAEVSYSVSFSCLSLLLACKAPRSTCLPASLLPCTVGGGRDRRTHDVDASGLTGCAIEWDPCHIGARARSRSSTHLFWASFRKPDRAYSLPDFAGFAAVSGSGRRIPRREGGKSFRRTGRPLLPRCARFCWSAPHPLPLPPRLG